jgi:hypothetical protein
MTTVQIGEVLEGASAVSSIETVVFDGGEPFLYYPILLHGLRDARRHGFRTCIITNGDWASEESAALAWLGPIADTGIDELQISDDTYHLQRPGENRGARALRMATQMDLPARAVSAEGNSLVHRGRAAKLLTEGRPLRPWESLDRCPTIDFANPDRIYVDFEGYVSLCHGLTIGSLWWKSLDEVLRDYTPGSDPILGPLLRGGPAALARSYLLPQENGCPDACYLCYLTREALRPRHPEHLAPDALYGALESPARG